MLAGEIVLAGDHQLEPQHAFATGAEQRQRAVRGKLLQWLGEIEIVRKLGAALLLAVDNLRDQQALLPGLITQCAHQVGLFRHPLQENLPRAVVHRGGIGKAGIGIEIPACHAVRRPGGILQQAVQHRLEAGFARDLCAGAAFGPIGRIQVFQPHLGVSGSDGRLQFRAQLVLFGDALQHRVAPLLQFAQIDQALLEVAQLGIVQPLSGLLAVA